MSYVAILIAVAIVAAVAYYVRTRVLKSGTDVPNPVAPEAPIVAPTATHDSPVIPGTTQHVSSVMDAILRSGAGYGKDGQGYGVQHASVDFRGSVIPWEPVGQYRYQPGKAGQPTIFSFTVPSPAPFTAPSPAKVILSVPYGPFTGNQAKWIVAKLDNGPEERLMVTTVAGTIQREVSPGPHTLSLVPDGDIPELRVQMTH